MPIYRLSEELIFPHPSEAEENGLLAIGGDLRPERLLLAYSNGIFPWPMPGFPLTWSSPNPRMVLFPQEFKLAKSLRQTLRNKGFTVKFDTQFASVIRQCARVKRGHESGTWITADMQNAYIRLHQLGFAHSVETYSGNELVGGLYGVSIGRAFFGESMFHLRPDTSKIALFYLVEQLKYWDFDLIDAQQDTPHLRRMGGTILSRSEFLDLLHESNQHPTRNYRWQLEPVVEQIIARKIAVSH